MTATMIRPNCGTVNGRQAHARHGETPCQDCRRAHADYQRARLARTGGPRTRQRLVDRVRGAEQAALDHRVLAAVVLLNAARLREVADTAQRYALADRPHLTEHAGCRLYRLAHQMEDNARRIDSHDAAVALRYCARAIRGELASLTKLESRDPAPEVEDVAS